MLANSFQVRSEEFFYCNMDALAANYTMYFPLLFNEQFKDRIFLESLELVMKSVSHLCCHVRQGFFRGKWEGYSDFKVADITEEIIVEDTMSEDIDLFHVKAYEKFTKLEKKKIDIFKEPPIKIKWLRSEDMKYSFVGFGIHHCIADGRGSMQLIDLVSQTYSSLLKGEQVSIEKNYRSIPIKYLNDGFVKMLKKTNSNMKKQFPQDLLDPLVETEDKISIDDRYDSTERISFDSMTMSYLKEKYSEYGYSTNDIFVHLMLKLQQVYSKKTNGQSDYLAVGVAVDSRNNIKKDILTITNYASMTAFVIEKHKVDDLAWVKQKLEEFKKESMGASFSMEFVLLNLFPFTIQKNIYQKGIANMIAGMSTKSIQTTNVGEMTRFVGDFSGSLKHISFIGPAGRYGMPIVSMSLYDKAFTMYIRKADDRKGLSREIGQHFRRIVNEQLNGDFVIGKGATANAYR